MNKISLFIFILLKFSSPELKAQTIQWLDTIHYSASCLTAGIATDSKGYVYTTGSYSAGHKDYINPYGIFISKYDSLGNLMWLDTINAGAACPMGLVVDNNGNSYVAVKFGGMSITFGNFTFSYTGGNCDMILVKYNSLGGVVWAKKVTNANPRGIYADKQGKIYVFGHTTDTTRFGSYSTGVTGNFIAKYDTMGNCHHAFSTAKEIINVSCDGSGNIYLEDRAGTSYPYYIKKYNSSGVLQWSKLAGTAGFVYTDNNGNCYLRGTFYGSSATFGSTTLMNPYSAGTPQWFVAKIDANGNYIWAIAPTDSSSFYGLCIDATHIYLTGNFRWVSPANGGLYVAKYDTNGILVSHNKYTKGHSGSFLSTNNSNAIYLTSSTGNSNEFTSFIMRISENSVASEITEIETTASIIVYPNPTSGNLKISINSILDKESLSIKLVDVLGKEVYTEIFKDELDVSRLDQGVYFLSLYQYNKLLGTKKIVRE